MYVSESSSLSSFSLEGIFAVSFVTLFEAIFFCPVSLFFFSLSTKSPSRFWPSVLEEEDAEEEHAGEEEEVFDVQDSDEDVDVEDVDEDVEEEEEESEEEEDFDEEVLDSSSDDDFSPPSAISRPMLISRSVVDALPRSQPAIYTP